MPKNTKKPTKITIEQKRESTPRSPVKLTINIDEDKTNLPESGPPKTPIAKTAAEISIETEYKTHRDRFHLYSQSIANDASKIVLLAEKSIEDFIKKYQDSIWDKMLNKNTYAKHINRGGIIDKINMEIGILKGIAPDDYNETYFNHYFELIKNIFKVYDYNDSISKQLMQQFWQDRESDKTNCIDKILISLSPYLDIYDKTDLLQMDVEDAKFHINNNNDRFNKLKEQVLLRAFLRSENDTPSVYMGKLIENAPHEASQELYIFTNLEVKSDEQLETKTKPTKKS